MQIDGRPLSTPGRLARHIGVEALRPGSSTTGRSVGAPVEPIGTYRTETRWHIEQFIERR